MEASGFLAVVFFFMIIMLGLDSAFAITESVTVLIHDRWPHTVPYRQSVAAIACILFFLPGLSMCTSGGIYILDLLDIYYSSYVLVFCALAEVVAIGWFYPIERYISDLKQNTFSRIPYPLIW